LGETGAVTSEIPLVRLRDLDDWSRPTAVRLPGTRRLDPRTSPLTTWGIRVVGERVRRLRDRGAGPDTLLAYTGSAPPQGQQRQASICNALRVVLDAAGLGDDPAVRPSSLRHWAGRRLHVSGLSIDQVARELGYRSLDACAEDVGLDWRPGAGREQGR
jgi:integrase/recombinase XerC